MDRRIQKTRKALTEALIQLILEKGYEQVTVQDILDRANVGRSTFYLHYENKDQLLLNGPTNLNLSFFSDDSENEAPATGIDLVNLFDHIEANKPLAHAMMGKNAGNIMVDFFRNMIAQQINRKYRKQFGKGKHAQRLLSYLSMAASASVVSLIGSWIEEEMPLAGKEMASLSAQLIDSVMKTSLSG